MIKEQEKFSSILTEIIEIEKSCKLDFSDAEHLKHAVDKMLLPIAVVGEFSAGKSTLLNKFIGKNILSVDILPETAIPSELYYSEMEYAEAVRKDGSTLKLNTVEENPSPLSDFVCVRRYLNSENLKKLNSIILVDMPGFASPLDSHHAAIINYLDKAVHYIVFSPADSGTISDSLLRELKNIQSLKKDFTFFITKTDLKSEEDNKEISEKIQDDIDMYLGLKKQIYKINHNNAYDFSKIIQSLNPEIIFKNVFIEAMKDLLYSIRCSINIRLAALTNDKKKNDDAIEALRIAIIKLEKKRDSLIEEKKQYSYLEEAEKISNAIGKELNNSLDSLTKIALTSGSEGVQEEINSIVKSIVISDMNDVLEKISSSFSLNLGLEVKELDKLFQEFQSPDFLNKLQTNAQNWCNSNRSKLDSYINTRKHNAKSNTDITAGYTLVTGVLAAATNIAAPVIEVLIIALPTILSFIVDYIKEQKETQDIRKQLAGQIPSIKREIKNKTVEILKEQTQSIIEEISAKFEDMLNTKKLEIENTQKEAANISDIEEEIKILKSGYIKIEELEREI